MPDLVKLLGVDSSEITHVRGGNLPMMRSRTGIMFNDNMNMVFLKQFREHFFQFLQRL